MTPARSPAATLRFNEVRLLLNEIRRQESVPPAADSETVAILRGLFYVHLYGAFEFAITAATQSLLQAISSVRVPYGHLEQVFYGVALDHRFSSLANRSQSGKWKGRRDLLSEQKSNDVCGVNDTIFSQDLQNIWHKTLVELFENLGIGGPVVPDVRFRGYIDEVVDKRNAVAHGRESPASVGTKRSSELEARFDAVSSTATYVMDCLDRHLRDRAFVSAAHREMY